MRRPEPLAIMPKAVQRLPPIPGDYGQPASQPQAPPDALKLAKIGKATTDRCARIAIAVVAILVAIFTPVLVWAAASSLSGQIGTSTGSFSTANNGLVVTPGGKYVHAACLSLFVLGGWL